MQSGPNCREGVDRCGSSTRDLFFRLPDFWICSHCRLYVQAKPLVRQMLYKLTAILQIRPGGEDIECLEFTASYSISQKQSHAASAHAQCPK